MYIYSKQKIYKSYKSKENKIEKSSEHVPQEKLATNHDKTLDTEIEIAELTETAHQKPTIVQDMLKIWNEEFPKAKITLSKQLARFLVAVFKTKFSSCLKEWKKYLKTLKTSAYIMSEKFKLSIWWVIKFVTVDRIKKGELGVNPDKITCEKEELTEKLNLHILSIDETEPCKKLRYKIIEKLSLQVYLSWFIHVNFTEDNGKIVMKAKNTFVRDWIRDNFADTCGLCLE
jgi:chromosomal replication initiation ATPase DnaA